MMNAIFYVFYLISHLRDHIYNLIKSNSNFLINGRYVELLTHDSFSLIYLSCVVCELLHES